MVLTSRPVSVITEELSSEEVKALMIVGRLVAIRTAMHMITVDTLIDFLLIMLVNSNLKTLKTLCMVVTNFRHKDIIEARLVIREQVNIQFKLN